MGEFRKIVLTLVFALGSVLGSVLVSVTTPAVHAAELAPFSESYGKDGAAPYSIGYYGIFFGPSIQDPAIYQPNSAGVIDRNLPLLVRNFMTANYNISNKVAVSATAPWTWKPVQNQELSLKDPYFRISHNELFSTEEFNLYGDARFHAPVTTESRNEDLLAGIQSFLIASYQIPGSRLTWGSYFSARYNVFGAQGTGNDTVLYAGPNLAYQLSPSFALTTLYEMGASHLFKDKTFAFNNDGTDLEPGIRWDITKAVSVNPYLNFFTGNKVSFASTSIGMTLSWQLL